MPDVIKYPSSIATRKGVALLMVLFIIMAVTVISLGILARADVELSCGRNMALRMQMDQMTASGLEHARGLVLNPQEVSDEYWTGADDLQLDSSSDDFYDVSVSLDASDPNDRCNYTIQCKAYRMNDEDEEVGCSGLSAELRLDPCIALWTGAATTLTSGLTVRGDVYCGDALTNSGTGNGDAFAGGTITGEFEGQKNQFVTRKPVEWPFGDDLPPTVINSFKAQYSWQPIGPGTCSSDLGTSGTTCLFYCDGDLSLTDGVTVNGMLLVDGSLTIRGDGVTLVAAKNVPALYVTGDLIVEDVDNLRITGLVVAEGNARVRAGASGISILGGVVLDGTLVETAPDSSGNHRDLLVYGAPAWQTAGGQIGGALEMDGVDDVLEDPLAGTYLNGLSAITVSFWVKSDVTHRDRGIMFTHNPTGADEDLGLRYDARGSYGGADSCIKASIRTTLGYTQIESSPLAQTTDWQHLALVWESGLPLELYIGGSLDTPTYRWPATGNLFGFVSGVQKLMVGLGTKGKYWDGRIDDVRIYNQALSVPQVSALWQGSFVGLPDPIAHWEFDEGGAEVEITADPAKAAIVVWPAGSREHWSPAAGAFFKAMRREQL